MKKIIAFSFLFLSIFTLTHFDSVFAHDDKNFSPCTTPRQGTIYESYDPWSSYYTYDQAVHTWVPVMKWAPPYSYKDSKGNTVSGGGYWYDDGYYKDDGYRPATGSCSVSFSHTPFNEIYSSAIINYWNVIASGSPGGSSGATSGTVYWVKQVDIHLTDGNGRTYLQGSSNGTTSTSTPIDGNPGNSNNSGLTTYSDEHIPSVTCTKIYGNGNRASCPPSASVDKANGGAGKRLTCYYWRDTYTSDSDKVCTVRIYVSNVKITSGATRTYTGKHYPYTCNATFADGTIRNVTAKDERYVWLSYPNGYDMKTFKNGRYIGTGWVNGYKDPRGIHHPPDSLHDFYPVDPENRTYKINCTYYPDYNWAMSHYGSADGRIRYQNGVISDYDSSGSGSWNLAKHDSITVTHIGISKMTVDVTGEFAQYNSLTKKTTYVEKKLDPTNSTDSFIDIWGNPAGWNLTDTVNGKSYSPGYWNQELFLTAHWYDFKAYITYTDGIKRDVTSAEEIYWDNSPWFKKQDKHNVTNIYDSGMSKTGLDHRIPQDGWNTIDVEYLHRNVPFGTTSINKTKQTNRLKSRQIKSLDITHESSPDTPPVKLINEGDNKVVQYHAWITWTDKHMGKVREDWTNQVFWDGDYLKKNGLYDFTSVKGKEQKATVYAEYKDIEDLTGTATRVTDNKGTTQNISWDSKNPNWDANYDKVEVIINDCRNVEHLAWKCTLPDNYWRIDILNNFNKFGYGKTPNSNFYPDSSYYNVSGWSKDTDIYSFERKFGVSGISTGAGNQ